MTKKESAWPYKIEFKFIDIVCAVGISSLTTFSILLAHDSLSQTLSHFVAYYFLFSLMPLFTLVKLWHPLIALPIFIVLLFLSMVIEKRTLRIILMALLLSIWQGYGMMCAVQGIEIAF